MFNISVIICCYNSSERLPKTLEYLSKQIIPTNFNWELIIVNNNSTDSTVSIAKEEWDKYSVRNVSFKIVEETKPGLNYAREKGIETSTAPYVIFCDDDNWFFPDYVYKAYQNISSNPEIGIVGGSGIALWEKSFHPYMNYPNFYATGKQSARSGDVTLSKRYVYGAGMVLSKEGLETIKKHFKFFTKDRTGKQLTSGGDNEICYQMILSGYKIWFNDELKFYHFIPTERITGEYLLKLNNSYGSTAALLKPYLKVLDTKNLGPNFYTYILHDILSKLHYLLFYVLLKNIGKLQNFDVKIQITFFKGYLNALFFNWRTIKDLYKFLSNSAIKVPTNNAIS